MKPTKSVTTHYFHIDRDPNWPDLPWPSYKPETKKMMRPTVITFKVEIEDGDVQVTNPTASGPRINSGGTLGAEVSDSYYMSMHYRNAPPFILALVEEAKRCIQGRNDS